MFFSSMYFTFRDSFILDGRFETSLT
jgi:hypothetical protein